MQVSFARAEAELALQLLGGLARRRVAWWLAAALVVSWPTRPAAAFCRESLMSQPSGPCIEMPGVPFLHWTRSCMTYVFNDQLFTRLGPEMNEAQIRKTFDDAYQTWADVDCGDRRSPFFVEQASETSTDTEAVFVYDEPNESLVVARTGTEWDSLPKHDSSALAFTLLWHDTRTGEILDVDMELNTGAGTFADCGVRGSCSNRKVDLSNTITHEAGHLLGLGHTTVPAATMTTTAIGAETDKRTLERDDRDGYCALDLPEFECADASCVCEPAPVFPSKRTVKTCSCRTLGESAAPGLNYAWLVGFGGVYLWRLSTRRRRER
jgi:hypothetical protein